MKFKNITFKLLAVGCLVIGLASCGEKPTYLEFQDVPSSNWNYSDTLSYTITLEEAVDNPEVELVVRNSADYPFQNFWVQVDQYQDSIKIAEFKHEVMLANPAGRWIGKKSGTLYTSYNPLPLEGDLSGNTEVKVVQIMRKNPLQGIQSIGIKVK